MMCACSTLLNMMFGTRLRTGGGKVTAGIHLQLVPCPGQDGYDHLLLMDTEGLQ